MKRTNKKFRFFKMIFMALGAIFALTTFSCSEDEETYRFIGDSIIHRWDLQNSFPTLITENCGLSGSGLEHLQSYSGKCQGTKVIVMSGTNDCGDFRNAQQAAEYAKEYVDALVTLGADRVYVYSILPRCFDTDPENINESVQLMNKAIYAELTARSGLSVVYLDVYNSFLDKDGSLNMNLSYDGLHLNPEGYEILTKALNKKIQ